jgi:NAD(P)-dependent dehydrogenase (short-subunit alcohol dehydrogenase family)
MAVTVVTGAGSGIGRATAQRFARRGATVVVADINEETGRDTVAEKIGNHSPIGCVPNMVSPRSWLTMQAS